MISVNLIRSCRDVIAICDSELIGKYLEDGNFQIDVKESFYRGEEYPEDKVKEIIRKMSYEDATFNIVGEKSCGCALNAGIISQDGIKKIQGVPFALVLL